jgi:hypothetical protein
MAITHNDRYLLSTDSTFQHRVQVSLVAASVAIANEGWNVVNHRQRLNLVNQILSNLNNANSMVQLFAITVATDNSCISDATQAGTVALTSGNVAAQAALVTDPHIDNAISSQFNAFIQAP